MANIYLIVSVSHECRLSWYLCLSFSYRQQSGVWGFHFGEDLLLILFIWLLAIFISYCVVILKITHSDPHWFWKRPPSVLCAFSIGQLIIWHLVSLKASNREHKYKGSHSLFCSLISERDISSLLYFIN